MFGFFQDGVALPPRVQLNEPFEQLLRQVNGVFDDANANMRFSLREVRRFTDP